MPSEEGGLKGLYNGLSDKAWAFAEWMESKGLPIASFCDKHHINPLLLLMLIFLAILVLAMFALGAFTGASYGTLTVEVKSGTMTVPGATVSYEFGGQKVSNLTNQNGKAEIRFPIGPKVTVTASKTGFKQGTADVAIEGEKGTASVSMQRKVGKLEVSVDVEGGVELPSGTYVKVESAETVSDVPPGTLPGMKSVGSDGTVTFDSLPAGAKVSVYLSLSGGDQRIPADPAQVTIQEDKTVTTSIDVTEDVMSTSLEVRVTDPSGQNVDGASVQLFDCDSGRPISSSSLTYTGSVMFNGVPLGSSVYATVNPPSGSYAVYNGKNENGCTPITAPDPYPIEISLRVIGVARVCVYDEDDSPAYLLSGTKNVQLKDTSGSTIQSKAIDSECTEFSGLLNGAHVYPVVFVQGYPLHSVPAEAQTVDYSYGALSFEVTLSKTGGGQQVQMYVHVSDCTSGDPISGVKVKIIDDSTGAILDQATSQCGGSASVELPSCGNVAADVEGGRTVYAVVYDDDYQLRMSDKSTSEEGGIIDVCTERVDESNSGDLDVCVYKNGQPADDIDVELYKESGDLLWSGNTEDDEEDPDYCYTFKNLPDGEVVYARATNLAANPVSSGTVTIVGGAVSNATIYSGTPPVILDKGEINVCVRNAANNQSMSANVTVYDLITEQAVVGGSTAGGGCRLFTSITAETNSGGEVVPREVYIIVNKTGYASYNGKDEDKILEMVPSGRLTTNVYLKESYPICVQVRASDTSQPMKDVQVLLYYNKTADAIIDSKTTPADGVVRFYQAKKDKYFFKLSEEYTLYEPRSLYNFSRSEVTGSNCGIMRLYDLGTLCDLGIEVFTQGTNFSVVSGESLKIPFRVLEGDDRGDESASTGTTASKHTVSLYSGAEANVTLKINGQYKPFTLNYESTDYSSDEELVASAKLDTTGTYSGVLEVAKNAQCRRQAGFTVKVFKEELSVSVDSVAYDPGEKASAEFCIYVTDEDGDDVTDASVTVNYDSMDGWASTASKSATYSETKACYRGSIAAALVPKDGVDYVSGTYSFSVTAKRGGLTKVVDTEAVISATELCGNGKVDSGEKCDGSAPTTGCGDDYECSDDCTKCEEKDCGSLSVSAESASLAFGSGVSSGFCVTVSDDCEDDVDDATVTATFDGSGGWASSVKVSASYDTSKSCYYVPIADSTVCPSGVRLTSASAIIGTKTVSVGVVDGDRKASTTVSASISCGCNRESWCEANCACDEDCDNNYGGLNFNLADCLRLGAQQGYTPTGSAGYMPYGYYGGYGGYGNGMYGGYGYGSCGMRSGSYNQYMGGLGYTGGTATLGGIGLNWEKCQELFGWGDKKAGSGVKDYTWVRDYAGIVKPQNCPSLLQHFASSPDSKYVFVSPGSGQNAICCTGSKPGVGTSGGSACKWTDFEKLMQSGAQSGKVSYVDIIDASDCGALNQRGLSLRVFPQTKGKVIVDGSGQMYSSGAVFVTTQGHVAGAAGTRNSGLIWGLLDKNMPFDVVFQKWKSESGGSTTRVMYPDLEQAQKNIILTDYEDTAVITGAGLTGSILNGQEKGCDGSEISDGNFASLGTGTNLYVIASSNADTTGVVASVAKSKFEANVPEFVEVKKPEYAAYTTCQAGVAVPATGSITMLKANPDIFAIATKPTASAGSSAGEYLRGCTKAADGKITAAANDFNLLKVGVEKRAGGKRVLVYGKDMSQEGVGTAVKQMKDKPLNDKAFRLVIDKDYGYGYVRAKYSAKQGCTSPKSLITISNEIAADIPSGSTNLPDSDISGKMVSCIWLKREKDPITIKGVIDVSEFVGDAKCVKTVSELMPFIKLVVTPSGGTPKEYSTKSGLVLEGQDSSKLAFTVSEIESSGGLTIYAKVDKLNDGKPNSKTCCGMTEAEEISKDDLKTSPVDIAQILKNKDNTNTAGAFKIPNDPTKCDTSDKSNNYKLAVTVKALDDSTITQGIVVQLELADGTVPGISQTSDGSRYSISFSSSPGALLRLRAYPQGVLYKADLFPPSNLQNLGDTKPRGSNVIDAHLDSAPRDVMTASVCPVIISGTITCDGGTLQSLRVSSDSVQFTGPGLYTKPGTAANSFYLGTRSSPHYLPPLTDKVYYLIDESNSDKRIAQFKVERDGLFSCKVSKTFEAAENSGCKVGAAGAQTGGTAAVTCKLDNGQFTAEETAPGSGLYKFSAPIVCTKTINGVEYEASSDDLAELKITFGETGDVKNQLSGGRATVTWTNTKKAVSGTATLSYKALNAPGSQTIATVKVGQSGTTPTACSVSGWTLKGATNNIIPGEPSCYWMSPVIPYSGKNYEIACRLTEVIAQYGDPTVLSSFKEGWFKVKCLSKQAGDIWRTMTSGGQSEQYLYSSSQQKSKIQWEVDGTGDYDPTLGDDYYIAIKDANGQTKQIEIEFAGMVT